MKRIKKTQHSTWYFLIAAFLGLSAIGFAGFKYFFKPQSLGINEVRGGVLPIGTSDPHEVFNVSISGTTYSYSYSSGYTGESTVRMDGVTQGGVFYPWGYSGIGASNFNPSAGVQFATADGTYTSNGAGGAPVLHSPALTYKAPPAATPYPSWDPSTTSGEWKKWPARATDPNNALCARVRMQPETAHQYKQSTKLSNVDLYMKCFNFDFDRNGRIEFLGDVEYFRRSITDVMTYIARGNKWTATPTDPANAVCKTILASFSNPKYRANPSDLMKCFDYDFDQNGKIEDHDRKSVEWLWQFVSAYQKAI